MEKLVAEKLRKGYIEATGAGTPAPPAVTTSARRRHLDKGEARVAP